MHGFFAWIFLVEGIFFALDVVKFREMRIQGITGICLNSSGSFELLCFR